MSQNCLRLEKVGVSSKEELNRGTTRIQYTIFSSDVRVLETAFPMRLFVGYYFVPE